MWPARAALPGVEEMKAVGGEKPAGLQVVVLVGGTQRPPPADALLPTSLVLGGAILPSLWL